MAVKLMDDIRRYICQSGDSKPTSMPVGSTLYESDTGKHYISTDGSTWTQYANNIYTANIYPIADNTYDLGSSALSFKNAHIQTAVYATSVVGNWNPSADDTYDLGENSTPLEWQDLYIDGVAYIDTLNVEVAGVVLDDVLFGFGTGSDGVILNRSTTLTADTALTGVLIGTPDTPALAANSLIISNITADGDILIAANDGGNSKQQIFIDGSTGELYLGNTYYLLVDGANGLVEPNCTFRFPDDKVFAFGASSDTTLMYETADVNAKMLVWALPHVDEDANNVAVLALVDRDASGADLGTGGIDLSGITQPSLVVCDEDSDSYVRLSFSADDTPLLDCGGSATGIGMTKFLSFTEMAAPGAGAANTARIYAFEGAGDALTDLCAVFQDGTVDVFAQESTEPDSPIFQFPDMTDLKLQLRKPNNKTVQFAALFPDGREFIMRELRYPEPRWN